ncbi:hypothetical protein FNF27_04333 [Cafeteria roenbergensis]|uniref:ubiquitinyl hydrolase 1 n=1 Tax=Cafeteria roenbergensis TaxID=33653 RepID=A0A5A8C0T8_CAFRO|nr:hypothetical protein FNF29_08051 [Cafeteria roenbergensis]KAA0174112.1 hypothetical protein FNF27_04333 [Cafeteria roenbergensis]|eukprot:KAA0146434.1 hypothetical protein FNF29_08051 [Cafeteria roenbergensis]
MASAFNSPPTSSCSAAGGRCSAIDEVSEEEELRLALIASQPQVGEAEGIDSIAAEYADNEQFRECAVSLGSKLGYTGVRRMRPDGSCFYRGWLWALLRHMSQGKAVYERLVGLHAGAVPRLAAAGLEPLVVEDFAAAFGEMLMTLPGSDPDVATALLSADMDSMYLLVMVRYLASAGVAEAAHALAPLLAAEAVSEGGGGGGGGHGSGSGSAGSISAYRRGRVEGTSAEADHVAIACLSAVTGVPVAVVSLSASGSPGVTVFPAGASAESAPVHLLLRPGHYDVLTRE